MPRPGLNIYTGNSLPILCDRLMHIISENPLDPMHAETIVTQSFGMGKWLSMRLADKMNVWCNYEYPFPSSFINTLFKTIIPEYIDQNSGERLFDTTKMSWAIMGLLDKHASSDEFSEIRNYLGADGSTLKKYQLSSRIADTFDQYITFRPDMLTAWESGEGTGWQPVLWRELRKISDKKFPPELKNEYIRALESRHANLPVRINLFGISFLTGYHLELLRETARYTEINFFILFPVKNYSKYLHDIALDLDIFKEILSPNQLISSMFKSGRDYLSLLLNKGKESCCNISENPLFLDIDGPATILESIKSNIVHDSIEKFKISKSDLMKDRSFRIHSCYGRMRELEVLYDNLLEMFESTDNIRPGKVVVMAPNIEEYAPYIEAVFGSSNLENYGADIPYSIADRKSTAEGGLIQKFFALIEIARGRFEAVKIIDLLDFPAMLNRFDLAYPDLDMIKAWVANSGIAWGIDGQHKEGFGIAPSEQNTWAFGIGRLLLGYAMPGKGRFLFNDILPEDRIEGSAAKVLGRFLIFFDLVADMAKKIARKRSIGDFSRILIEALDNFFDDDKKNDPQRLNIINHLNALGEYQSSTGFKDEVSIDVIISYLRENLGTELSGRNYLNGSVTFCSMLPMRSIPFDVIWLLGMDEGVFPRAQSPAGFDLIYREGYKLGDRVVREEDRYLFLETIISAGKRLHISYIGRDIKDNLDLPPSVVVSELLDFINETVEFPDGNNRISASGIITTLHRLQPFNSAYFSGSNELFSYSDKFFKASENFYSGKLVTDHFMLDEIIPVNVSEEKTNLSDIIAFYKNPSKYLLKNIFQISFDIYDDNMLEHENFEIESLQAYGIGEDIFRGIVSGADEKFLFQKYRNLGSLPHGSYGSILFENMFNDIKNRVSSFEQHENITLSGEISKSVFSLDLGPSVIECSLGDLWPTGIINFKYASIKPRDILSLWIKHLALCSYRGSSSESNSYYLGKERLIKFKSVPGPEAIEYLRTLYLIYTTGLSKKIYFSPGTSNIFYEKLLKGKGKDPEAAFNEAVDVADDDWQSDDVLEYQRYSKDSLDPYVSFLFSDFSVEGVRENPDHEFFKLAAEVYGPVYKYLTDKKQGKR